MAEQEKYLVLRPDGSMEWITTAHEQICSAFRSAIGCEWLENVTLPYGFCCVVDECGKIKDKPQLLNPYASMFYPGTLFGDPLVGPVVFCRIGLYQGESDWVPLIPKDLDVIEMVTGLSVPR